MWRDISEAKRDGRFVLAIAKSDPTTAVAVQCKVYDGKEIWVRKSGIGIGCTPTHFMELPEFAVEAGSKAA